MILNEQQIGYIKYFDEFYNIKVTQQLIYKARIEVMNEITFTKEATKRKRTTTIDEEEITQNNPSIRINNGQEFEKAMDIEYLVRLHDIYHWLTMKAYKPIVGLKFHMIDNLNDFDIKRH